KVHGRACFSTAPRASWSEPGGWTSRCRTRLPTPWRSCWSRTDVRLPSGKRLVTAGEMAAIDHAAISGMGIPSLTLMARAGRESANAIVAWWRGVTGTPDRLHRRSVTAARPPRGRVIVLAGRGNNGGDGFVCARHLKAAGFTVRILVAGEESSLSEDAAASHAACERERMPVTFLPDPRAWGEGSEAAHAARQAMFLVDALLGTGSQGAPRGAVAAAIEMAEGSAVPIASIDIPSDGRAQRLGGARPRRRGQRWHDGCAGDGQRVRPSRGSGLCRRRGAGELRGSAGVACRRSRQAGTRGNAGAVARPGRAGGDH